MPQAVGLCSAALTAQSNESLHLLLRVADEIRADVDLLRSCRNGAFRAALFMNLEPLLATIGSAPSQAG